MAAAKKRLGEMLVDAGAMDAAGVQLALSQQRVRSMRFGQTAVDLGLVGEDTMVRTLALQLGVSAAQLDAMRVPPGVSQLIPRDVAQRYHVFPLGLSRDNGVEVVFVATAEPQNLEGLTALQTRLGRRIRPVLAGHNAIGRALGEPLAPPRSDPSNALARPGASAAATAAPSPARSSSASLRTTGSVPTSNPANRPPGAGTAARLNAVGSTPGAPTVGGRGAVLLTPGVTPGEQAAPTLLDMPAFTLPEMAVDVTLDSSLDVVVEHEEDLEPTAIQPMPQAPAHRMPDPPPNGTPATFSASPPAANPPGKDPRLVAGSVYMPPAPAMTAQVRAMVKQRLVDDELVWVFIDQHIITETEATALRGAPLPPRRGSPR
jgi:hypothetical protein